MEFLVRYIVSNRSFSLLMALIIAVIAWVQIPNLRISQYPVVKLPTLMVKVVFPGASAIEIEQRVIRLIEEKLQNTKNLFKFTTHVYNSHASIMIRYDYGVDIDDEYVEINSKINNIKTTLPEKAEVVVLKQSPIDLMVSFVLGVSSETASMKELRNASGVLSQKLRQLKSIEEVTEIFPEEEIRIDLDLARVEASNIDIAAIERTISGNNQYLPTGTFDIGDKALSVVAFGNGFTNIEQIRESLVINRNGKPLAIRDIATVQRQNVENAILTSINGKPAVLVTMKLSESANIFQSRQALSSLLESVKLANNIDVEWLYDAENGVSYKLDQLGKNIITGMIILSVVLVFSVGWRSAFIISAMLPAALFLSIVGLSFSEYGIQEISLAGFIIALGLIVDNGIVVTENAYKLNHYGGYSHEEAAIKGTASVIMPLLSSTATTALAFAPLFLLTSTTGLFLHSLVAVLWLCLASSLFAAILISSVMIARLGTLNSVPYLPALPSFLIALIPFRDNFYRKTLVYFIRRPFVLLSIILVLLGLSFYAASKLKIIVFPDSEDPFFTVTIETPQDRNAAYTLELSQEIFAKVAKQENVESCTVIVGRAFPMVHTGAASVATRPNNAQIFCEVNFRDAQKLNQHLLLLNQLLKPYEAMAKIDAASFSVGGVGGLPDVSVELRGPGIQQLRDLSVDLESHLRASNLEGAALIDNEAQSRHFALNIEYKARRAAALGVDRGNVDRALVLLIRGMEIDKYRDVSGNEYPIVMSAESDSEDPLNVFDRIFVTSSSGATIPLSQLVDISFKEAEFDIVHKLFQPQVSIDVSAFDHYSVSRLTREVKEAVAEFELPSGVSVAYAGKVADQASSFGGIVTYVGIIGLVILAIFVYQFGSIIQPIIICAAIPLSFIGAFALLYVLNQPLSFLAFIGLTSLMGIVINNSILLVDEGNQLRKSNPESPISDVAIQAGLSRFMPILLTSVTSIAGLLPLALGESMFKALALVVIGGLSTSTFLTLICIPVLYTYTTKQGDKSKIVTQYWQDKTELTQAKNP